MGILKKLFLVIFAALIVLVNGMAYGSTISVGDNKIIINGSIYNNSVVQSIDIDQTVDISNYKGIQNIYVEQLYGSVEFRESTCNNIQLVLRGSSSCQLYIETYSAEDYLEICVKSEEQNFSFDGTLYIYVPSDLKPSVDLITVSGDVLLYDENMAFSSLGFQSTSGNVEILSSFQSCIIETVSGNIHLAPCAQKNVQIVAYSISGDIYIELTSFGNCIFRCQTISGNIVNNYTTSNSANGFTAEVTASTVSGNVSIR